MQQLISAIREVTTSFHNGACFIFFITSLLKIISVIFNVANLIKVSPVLNDPLVFPVMYETSREAYKIGFSGGVNPSTERVPFWLNRAVF